MKPISSLPNLSNLEIGHLLRGFVKRWLRLGLGFPLSLMLEPGGVGILSYEANDINQPALMVGMGFPLAKGE